MTTFRLIIQNLRHYIWSSLATAAGIAIASAIIIGALIIGDSLRQSLKQIVYYRLGDASHTITAGDRLFTQQLAYNIAESNILKAAPVLKSEAIVSVQESDARVSKVQIWGIDSMFAEVTGADLEELEKDGLIMSGNLAERLNVSPGDFILLRIRTINSIPSNTPFVSEEGQTITRRMPVSRIIGKKELSHFNLQSSQTAPYNIFVSIEWLNQIMELENKANIIVLHASAEDGNFIREHLVKSLNLDDLGLQLARVSDSENWKLTAERVFIDESVSHEMEQLFPSAQPHLTYFANSLQHKTKETPYSFVTATNHLTGIQAPDEMIINQWLADDLEAHVGDSLLMRFFVVGPLRELEEKEEWFRISAVISMADALPDSILMPHLPGLSDAGSCRDWDTGVPINLDKIRQKDEDYWDDFKGTPKAYISLAKGRQLWQNRFGDLTTIILPGDLYKEQEIRNLLTSNIDPFQLEYQVNPVLEQGLEAAGGGVDFGQLFSGLGMFIIISGLLLSVLLLQYNLKKREGQIQLFASMGFSRALIRKIVMVEASLIIIFGSFAGLLISLVYTRLVFAGLNRIWYDIVRTDVLLLHFDSFILLAGMVISIILGFVAVFWGTGKIIAQHLNHENENTTYKKKSVLVEFAAFLSGFFFLLFLGLTGYALIFEVNSDLSIWLIAGIALLLGLLSGLFYGLKVFQKTGLNAVSLHLLIWKNLTRNPSRSFTILTLLALGSFVIVVTAANQKDLTIDPSDASGGTGGFEFIAETTIPVLTNLNMTETQNNLGLPDNVNYVQFLTAYDDDASCHNLNRVANPRLLATEPYLLSGRFSFAADQLLSNTDHPWLSLDDEYSGCIPAIADQSVIQWGLGKSIGDTLYYINASGEEIRVLLVGGLNNSVLQGNLIISQKKLLENFPSVAGSSVFLVDVGAGNMDSIKEELQFLFRDYGWDMTTTQAQLAGFNSVENTYLQIFFMMGALGMLLGTIGLAIVIAKSMIERASETAVLRAMGFSKKVILYIYFTENFLLFVVGLLAGTLSGLIATMPSFLSGSQNVATGFLVGVWAVLLINGVFWIWLVLVAMVKGRRKGFPVESLNR
jgi:ABC-type lipoprotein release transport system permease subunit